MRRLHVLTVSSTLFLASQANAQVLPINFDLGAQRPQATEPRAASHRIALPREWPTADRAAIEVEHGPHLVAYGANRVSDSNLQHRDWHMTDGVQSSTRMTVGVHWRMRLETQH